MCCRLWKITTQSLRNISTKKTETLWRIYLPEPSAVTIENLSKFAEDEDGLLFYNDGRA